MQKAVDYRLRPISFVLGRTASGPGATVNVLKNKEIINAPFIIVGAQLRDVLSKAFDFDNFDIASMGLTSEYEAVKKLSLLSVGDDNGGRFTTMLMYHRHLIDFEIDSREIVLTGVDLAAFPIVHILEKIL